MIGIFFGSYQKGVTMDFLTKNKTKESYVEKIANDPAGTQRNKLYSIRNLERFVESKHHEVLDNIIIALL